MDAPRRWLGLQAILLTGILTALGVAFASEAGGSWATWIAIPVYCGALFSVITLRFQVLRPITRNQALPAEQRFSAALVVSFSATMTMAAFGLVSLLIGEGWVALPFGLSALATWVLLTRYSREAIEART